MDETSYRQKLDDGLCIQAGLCLEFPLRLSRPLDAVSLHRDIAGEVIRSLGNGNHRLWRSLGVRLRPVQTVILSQNAAGFYVVEVPLHKYRGIEEEMRLEREVRVTNQRLAFGEGFCSDTLVRLSSAEPLPS